MARFTVGALGTIEDVDAEACAMLGYSKAELVGLHGSELIPAEHRPSVAVSLDRIRQGTLSHVAPALLKRKDGSVITVEVTAQRLRNNRLSLSVRAMTAP